MAALQCRATSCGSSRGHAESSPKLLWAAPGRGPAAAGLARTNRHGFRLGHEQEVLRVVWGRQSNSQLQCENVTVPLSCTLTSPEMGAVAGGAGQSRCGG